MRAHRFSECIAAKVVVLGVAVAARALPGTAFTYQGQLKQGGSPANGAYDFQFTLFDAEMFGMPVSGTVTLSGVNVADGLFTVGLDFGAAAFTGERRWLQVAVKPAGAPAYTTLSPRQEVTPTPYCLLASTMADESVTTVKIADGAVTTGKLPIDASLDMHGCALDDVGAPSARRRVPAAP